MVSIQFTEVDFRLSPEDDQNLTVRIERRLAIAAPLSVLIYPINNTLARAAREGVVTFEGERLQVPDEIVIPDSSRTRPSDAKSELLRKPDGLPLDASINVTGVMDFDVTPIRIVMEPRETSQQDFPFTVSVVPDKINEATEFFILILRVESPSNGAVDSTSRNATRCAIVDDDRECYSYSDFVLLHNNIPHL